MPPLRLMRLCGLGAEAGAWPRRVPVRMGEAAQACRGCGRVGIVWWVGSRLTGGTRGALVAWLAKGERGEQRLS